MPPGASTQLASSSDTIAFYNVTTSASFATLVSFYDAHMPKGRPWMGYAWCREDLFTSAHVVSVRGVPGVRRIWRRSGTNDFLVLSVDGPGATTPPTVDITDDRNDPMTDPANCV